MALHIFRVTVRGQFASLDDSASAGPGRRRTLGTRVAQAAFTRTGTFTYELPLISFSYRFEIRVDDEDDDPPMPAAAGQRGGAALADLIARGIVARRLCGSRRPTWPRCGAATGTS